MYKLRLANVMGMDIDNAQHGVGIMDALNDIVDQDDFVEYCRRYKDGIQYSNRVEKLDTLATKYKSEVNNIPTELLENICRNLESKFKAAIGVLRDNEEYLSADLTKLNADGKQYFNGKEIELLDGVGGLNRLISLNDMGALYEKLYGLSVKKTILKKNNNLLTTGQSKVQKLMKTPREMR